MLNSKLRMKLPFLMLGLACLLAGTHRSEGAHSIARVWDEEILAAIRIDLPHPPVHARNLFHLSAAMYDACRRHRIPIGLAPNIEVSLVVNPDDAALLAPRDRGFWFYEIWRRSLRLAAQPLFRQRLRAGPEGP